MLLHYSRLTEKLPMAAFSGERHAPQAIPHWSFHVFEQT
jgi:hypothetical protein